MANQCAFFIVSLPVGVKTDQICKASQVLAPLPIMQVRLIG